MTAGWCGRWLWRRCGNSRGGGECSNCTGFPAWQRRQPPASRNGCSNHLVPARHSPSSGLVPLLHLHIRTAAFGCRPLGQQGVQGMCRLSATNKMGADVMNVESRQQLPLGVLDADAELLDTSAELHCCQQLHGFLLFIQGVVAFANAKHPSPTIPSSIVQQQTKDVWVTYLCRLGCSHGR